MKITILLLIPVFNIVCDATKTDNRSRKHLGSEVKIEVWPTSPSTSPAPGQPSHQDPMSRSPAQAALKPSPSLALTGQKSKPWLCCQCYSVCLTGRHTEIYTILKMSHSLRKKIKPSATVVGEAGKIPHINETEELLLLRTLPVMRNNLTSHVFPQCHEGIKNSFEASLIKRLDYSRRRREICESLSLLIVTPHLLFFFPALPPYPDGLKGFEVSPCFATQCVFSLW